MTAHTISPGPSDLPARGSLSQGVYARLVEGILSGQYGCGDHLNEVDLAGQLQVSRTPVREALRRLASEGLVATAPNRQSTVIRLTRADVIEMFQVRQFLEVGAARLTAERVTAEDLRRLRELATLATPSARPSWMNAERTFDQELHHAVAVASGNERLRQEIARYHKLVQLVRRRVGRSAERLAVGHTEHLLILAALEARDPDSAHAAMNRHLGSALEAALRDPMLK